MDNDKFMDELLEMTKNMSKDFEEPQSTSNKPNTNTTNTQNPFNFNTNGNPFLNPSMPLDLGGTESDILKELQKMLNIDLSDEGLNPEGKKMFEELSKSTF